MCVRCRRRRAAQLSLSLTSAEWEGLYPSQRRRGRDLTGRRRGGGWWRGGGGLVAGGCRGRAGRGQHHAAGAAGARPRRFARSPGPLAARVRRSPPGCPPGARAALAPWYFPPFVGGDLRGSYLELPRRPPPPSILSFSALFRSFGLSRRRAPLLISSSRTLSRKLFP